MELQAKVGILGSGLLGKQLAVLFASRGHGVLVWNHVRRPEFDGELLRLALVEARRGNLEKDVAQSINSRVRYIGDMEPLADSDLIIETVKEDEPLKRSILANLSSVLSEKTIVATNTSTFSVNRLSAGLPYASRFLGLHFFNPATSSKLVEVVRSERTSPSAIERALQLLGTLGVQPVVLPESPGNVVNRILFLMINEAARVLEQGVADAATIDKCMKLGAAHPLGPLDLADFVGLDVCHSILETLFRETGDEKFRPAPILIRLVREGKLGRKSGQGFHSHRKRGERPAVAS